MTDDLDILLDENTLDFIFQNMDNAVCITQKNGVLKYLNSAAAALFGITPESIGQLKIWEVIPVIKRNDALVQLFLDAVLSRQKTQQALVDYVNNEKKASKLWVSIIYVEDNDGEFVVVISDMTQLTKINAAFERYTSPQIADFVLNDPAGEKQGGESKDVTILMSDLRGFTAMSADLSPDLMVKTLNYYFERMVSVIERCGGTVIEFLGDGIFVVFGAPKDDPDHAAHAVACAVRMQNVLHECNERYLRKDCPHQVMEMGIGIHSGEAVVGNIGSRQKMKYGVMGYTVNLAGRIESLTIGGQIFISEDTKALIGDDLHILAQNSIMFKGATEPLIVYDISGIGKVELENISMQSVEWKKLSPEKTINFFLLDGKHVTDKPYLGIVTAVSANQHFALLRTESVLKKNDNIMLRADIDLYAKVVGTEEDRFIVSFTMRTEGFSDWIKNLPVEN